MQRVLPPRLVLSQLIRSLDQWSAQGGLVLLSGSEAVLASALRAVASLLAKGEQVVFIDSANTVNPFLIAEVATRMNKPPEELLDRLHISRTCTVHQLEALITERIARALHTYASRTLIASGFLHNFYDEDVAPREAWRIFRKAVAHLRALADAGTLVLVVCPAPAARGEPSRTIRLRDRDGLLDALIATADRVIKLVTSTTSATLSTGLSLKQSVRVRSVAKRLDHEWEQYRQDSSDG
jgi:hypothetical protein